MFIAAAEEKSLAYRPYIEKQRETWEIFAANIILFIIEDCGEWGTSRD